MSALWFSAHAESPAAGNIPKWKFASEEHWIVDETARSIAEMLAFAKDGTADAVKVTVTPIDTKPHAYKLQAELGGVAVASELALQDHVWSPQEHAAWAKALLAGWKLAPATPPAADADFLSRLTEPTPAVLLREARRLSAALTKAPLDSALHAQAALVTEAFALREAAREFSDYRRELCRAAAHLAIAQALQPEAADPARRMAQAALDALAERQAKALETLAALEKESGAGMAAWMRALRMRATGDWRPETEKPTLFEKLETFRARAQSIDAYLATNWLKDQKPPPLHDWRRLVLTTDFGVEEGHQFAKESIGQEILSLKTDWAAYFGGKLDQDLMIKALTEPPGRAVLKGAKGHPSISVLGWDFWSAQHQRHLCRSISATDRFLEGLWGVPEYREVRKGVRQTFSPLPLFPLLERILNENPDARPGIIKKINTLLTEHPERVGGAIWGRMAHPDEENGPPPGTIDPLLWLGKGVPFGTAYDFKYRSEYLITPDKSEKAWWKSLTAIAPANWDVLYDKFNWEFGKELPPAIVEAAYSPMKGFSAIALWQIAEVQKDRPAEYAATMGLYATLVPNMYFKLGDYHRKHDQPDLAVAAYRKGVELCPDRISVSNQCGWLVQYLEDHSETTEALKIATMAAEVYSYGGLETLAKLQERLGQFKEAEDIFLKIAERYESGSGEPDEFYTRNRAKDPDYETRATGRERKLFPKGLEKVTLAQFKEPPDSGIFLKEANAATESYGLAVGDVLVAVDGVRDRNLAQYTYLRSLSSGTKMKVIVWSRHAYREIETDLPERKFGVDIDTYPPR